MTPLVQSLNFFSRYWFSLTIIFVIAGIPAEISSFWLEGIIGDGTEQWVSSVSELIAQAAFEPLATGAAIFFIASCEQESQLSIKGAFSRSWLLYSQLFISYLAVTFLVLLGFSLYLIPGIYLLYKFLFVEYLVVLENQHPLDALRNSFTKTGDHGTLLIPVVSVLIMILIGGNLLIGSLVSHQGNGLPARLLGAILEAPITAFATVTGFRLYSLVMKAS